MTESKICTCPSGDGSLVHPCPAHPAVEQAGGDERAAFEKIHTVPRGIMWNEEKSQYVRVHEKHCSLRTWNSFVALWAGWMARAALAQPSPVSEALIYACKNLAQITSSDGSGHADIAMAVLRMAGVGDDERERLVNEWKAARAWKPAPAQAEQAEAERLDWPSALLDVAVLQEALTSRDSDERMKNMDAGEVIRRAFGKLTEIRAQHERIVGALRTKADQLREALEWRKENQAGQRELLRSVTAERDAALARVAELEKQEPVAHLRASDLERLNQPGIAGSAGSLWNGPREGFVPLYAAPVAQAQHSVPEGWVQSLPLKDHQPCKPNEDRANGYTIPIYSRPVLVEEALRKLRAVLCDPIGNVVIDGSDGDREEVQRALGMLAAAPGKEGV